jgi:prepilin-type N-terminal cleavage/methylation domain-containing protein
MIPRSRAGSTLLELMVSLAILGVVAGVAGVALRASGGTDSAEERGARLAAARRAALDRRRTVLFTLPGGVDGVAFPDGRVLVGDSTLNLDPLAGRVHARE